MSEEQQPDEDLADISDRVMPDRRRGQAPLLNGVAYRGLRNIMIGVTIIILSSSITTNVVMYGAIETLKVQVSENTNARREHGHWTAQDAARQASVEAATITKLESRMEKGFDELGDLVWKNKQEHADHTTQPCHSYACEILRELRSGKRNGSAQ